jgi:hypothetical protein
MMVCLLKTITTFAQPVIKVPPMCEVVVAGTGLGASTGFGGAVGNGGIVVMPDPFDFPESEGNFYYASNDYELIQWELLGDLSLQTETSYNEALQLTGAINPVNIQSYNKKLRLGEMPSASQSNLDPRWARSKGRIVVTYYDRRCLEKIKFDVYKRYKNDKEKNLVPPILGSDCVLPNTTYTFSVDPIASDNPTDEIGFDSYYWSGLPDGCTLLYNSPDNSSITIKTGENVSSFTLQCCYGRANDWDGNVAYVSHTTCVSKSIIGTPRAPQYIVAPPSCHPTGVSSFTIVYPNTSNTYVWTSSTTGWTINPPIIGTTNTSLTINTPNNNPGDLVMTITSSACVPTVFTYQINRSFTAPLTVIPTGSITNCISSTSNGNSFTLSPSTSNSIVWSIENLSPNSLTGITLQNATSSTVTVNTSGTAGGSFSLIATSGTASCNTTSVSYTINVKPATPIFSVGTPNCVARSATAITTVGVTPISGATYDWTPLPAGVTISGANNIANPSFIFNSAVGTNSVTLSVKVIGTNGCNSATTTKTINYIAVSTNFPGGGFPDQYLVNGACGAVTSWVIGTGVAPNQVFTTYTATSGNVSVTSIGGGTNNVLSISGSGGLAITSVCANLPGPIQVCASTVGSLTQRPANNPIKGEIKNVIISPNPNNGNFTIKVAGFNESASATLTDFSGNEIQTYKLHNGDNKIEKEGLQSGTYFVVLRVDGKQEARQIIIK